MIKFEVNCSDLLFPKKESFELWKNEFLETPFVDNYDMWLVGGFIEEWKSPDIDIILTKSFKNNELKTVLKNAVEIGIKHKIMIDIAHCNIELPHFNKGDVIKTVYGDILVFNDRFIARKQKLKCIYKDLYSFTVRYPNKKQKKKNYKFGPIKLN
ncbi:hypothetical protein OAS41_01550 [Candidatus Marinimicrobia bacterium]|nr:hypothetical protein [Candidatus Neomarinimicrobiota bacterium]